MASKKKITYFILNSKGIFYMWNELVPNQSDHRDPATLHGPDKKDVTEIMNAYTQQIDTSGLSCPLPILKSKKALKKMDIGQILSIISTDHGSVKDIASWCRVTGQELMATEDDGNGVYTFLVKRLK